MRNKAGTVCMLVGAVLILGALSLFLHNQAEASQAGQAVVELMPQIAGEIESIRSNAEQDPEENLMEDELPPEFLDPEDLVMTETVINGYAYIGYLSFPELELELPIMSDWNYKKLQIAPCRYAGTVRGNDLVLMAHNYPKHFGQLSELSLGDSVFFADMDGTVTEYEVVGEDVLDPSAVEEMTSGEFDLTLFTCTYGGKSRVTVYCNRKS